jgi:hypothetical protein
MEVSSISPFPMMAGDREQAIVDVWDLLFSIPSRWSIIVLERIS